jgi:hypothetical protein
VARAAAPHVVVVPSSREPVFARALVEQAGDPSITLEPEFKVESLADASQPSGELHVYGRDETIADIRARAPEHVRVRGHGTGLGLACVTGAWELDASAKAVARDVVVFDQRGCLSPRVVLFFGSHEAAERLCGALDESLASIEKSVPRGRLESEEWAAAARYISTLAYAGRVWRGTSHVVGLAPKGAPLWIPPAGRHLHVVALPGMKEARALVANVAHFVTAVGSDAPSMGNDLVEQPVRVSLLGEMQKPRLDGPVDLRD